MDSLLEQAHAILTSDGWSLMPAPGGTGLVTRMADDLDWSVMIVGDDQAGIVSCYSVLGEAVPSARRGQVMELLTRENFGRDLVAFEIDLDDGEVRCRSALALGRHGSRELTPHLLRPVVASNVAAAQETFPRVMAVALDGG